MDNDVKIVTPKRIVEFIWSGKLPVLICTFIFSVASVFYSLSLPNLYRAEVLLLPTNESASNLGALNSQLGGLASLVGANFQSRALTPADFAKELLGTKAFVSQFIEQHKIGPMIYAADGWDPEERELLFDPFIYNQKDAQWVGDYFDNNNIGPSSSDYFSKFSDMVSLSSNRDSNIITISVVHLSPDFAAFLSNELVSALNNEVRDRSVRETQDNIKYLNKQIGKAVKTEIVEILYDLLQAQMQSLMLADGKANFAFDILDPAITPDERFSPSRSRICVLGAIVGFLVGVLWLVIIRVFK